MPPDPFTRIPADIQAFRDGWTEITDHGHPYEVVLARDFSDDYLAERICGTFRNMGDKVTSSLVSLGKEGVSLHHASGNDLEVAFDRGYGKLSSVEAIASRNLHVVTVAGTLGSRHPFNTPDEWISTLNKWKTKRGVDQQKILSWTLLCENWNLRGDPMLGEEVRIAERTKVGEKPIYAIALKEVFDRKNPVKYLKFFASKNHRPYTFVAVERNEHLDQNVLFSPKTPSPERSSVEQALLQSAQPLTVGQRCADWFLMKSMLLSGTMAGKIGTSIMEECIVSWFGRHKSTAMMASGTRNENPTLDRLRSSVKCMKGIFEVGLLRWNRNHAIGVSPDAICRLVVKDNPDPVLCCLEIKTRVAESTIVKAELARKKHGSFVNCSYGSYGDAVFNDCVPAANRYQVLHQALVTGFQHGVFVVCKLEEGQGSIVQIVVIKISTEQRDEYAENLCKVVNPLLGWLHSEDVIARGILMDSDFPDWVTDPQRRILKTRAKLYYGHLKLITTEEGDLRPTKPVSIYKHSTQYRYNKHKPGLDKNTEISDRVAFHTTGPFEAKYVFRMLDAVMVNAWRAYQAVTVISLWLRALGSHPSLAQVRTKLNNSVGVEDFVADVALECLRCLAAQKAIPLFPAVVPQEEREVRQFKSEFSEYKRKHGWPIRKFALKKFASDPFLKKLRLCTFVDHRPQRIRDVQPVIRENGTSQKVVRRKCVLCFVPGKMIPGTSTINSKEIANNSTYMCPTCMVVLCKKTVGNSGAKSCHTLWHERHNLEAEGSKCRKRLRVAREMNDDEAQKRKLHATNASIKRHSPAKTSQQIQRSQTQVAINDPQDPQDSFDTVENVVEHVLENLMEMEHGEEHGDEEKEEDEHDFLDMEEYSDGSDE
ncbi:hypothetical protein IV203_025941 [Nitzschia inconspicua]|uniref:YqaJ viral recombinase domain-containing protein n=1 Tax=Nitzschia inconspicua TaxID=303405 RepID=A0A9K3K6E8_9STRA|nr:hypothetical protein IV203_017743 [Nitzschia inconspicua]KAG7362275.1 hypothetical protein IV203_025941 [Nitzschia inconspicua]